MTTPQETLQNIRYQLKDLTAMLKGGYAEDDENKENILQVINRVDRQNDDILYRFDKMENMIHLVIKLLSKT